MNQWQAVDVIKNMTIPLLGFLVASGGILGIVDHRESKPFLQIGKYRRDPYSLCTYSHDDFRRLCAESGLGAWNGMISGKLD